MLQNQREIVSLTSIQEHRLPTKHSMNTINSTDVNDSSQESSDSTKILGGLLGGAVGLALICAVICYLAGRQQRRYSKKQKGLKATKVRFTGKMLEKELDLPVFEPPPRAAQSMVTRSAPSPPSPRT